MNELLQYLKTRRSGLAMTLVEPAPDAGQIRTMVEIASRVPDHCKLAPWRFVEYGRGAREKLATSFSKLSDRYGDDARRLSRQKQIDNFRNVPLVIGVVSCPVDHPKVPVWEQELSAGAATMQLLMAANALGYEAQWLSGFYIFDDEATRLLGLSGDERLAGMVHIGSARAEKKDRTRPALDTIFSIHAEEE
jgi:nitroreductase